ncbi:glycine oxidase ThiO [Anabaena cylindrica FACHB-243]|uniref:Thiazole synthase n=1 Tax=Anabaena cylindrica (strain ATCC 27899 / PCC 7122) TaxID=272123 RepID=K9ZBA4_ANACC|nr:MULTISPECIES: glycine oxidase ThiO [Anabaena]AFZ56483.1 thiazole-phosphate synthase [Anabaena cylindrica PCC 7122]MBD2418068.1 glycine oxidase ThiO [Anabaena cylindrica FACHB-243]MBY5285413.1 glycine oxidase ThiO [Anabaena sp. CCAP 1446/1C]MBY5310242.1 glycine oxidase ThiO [Anabaena sp. CCAP 1446/1C]MCM2407344.1 glycine oxidase ThiO [Anabaena sp. CCAP 1446/1C]
MTSDILIIGGGVIGLACAVELKLRGAGVTVLCRNFSDAASHAAAGMLAPDAEKISNGAMLSLCWRSRFLYPRWTRKLEDLTGLNTGYWPCGILAPVYQEAGEQGAGGRSKDKDVSQSSTYWLDKAAIEQYQPGLGADVIGGWWYPEDGQVDNRALVKVLRTAAESLGVEFKDGVTVDAIAQQQGKVIGVQTNLGLLHASHYVLAAGAWANQLLPLPVIPRKGQMLSLRVPESVPELPLTRVLYGENIYIVPRRNRSIVLGATSEDVGFTADNTPDGIQSLLQAAIRLYPQLANYPIQEMWWGFRPSTADELPILGNSHCDNLTLATGHFRNGILLAPVTAELIADLIWEKKADPLLANFHYSRFQAQSSTTTSMLTHSANFTNRHGNLQPTDLTIQDSSLIIAGKTFQSRLMTGTGKYRSIAEMQQSVAASGCQIVTVAVRRVQTKAPGHEGLAEALDWNKIWMLPNTAGCQTAEEAIRVARLGREMAKLLGQEDNNFVKLEVIPDAKYLLPDPIGTLQAAEQLVKEGFAVLPYINADPMLAKRLEEVGCATVMPLAAPIGSGQGLKTTANIQIIIENANIPVVVDAGIGAPSEASEAMELGADALLINSAIALAQNAPAMAYAMNLAAVAGRMAYLAGRMPMKNYASASSPLTGTIT